MLFSSSIEGLYTVKPNRRERKDSPGNRAAFCLLVTLLAFLCACSSMPARQTAAGSADPLQEYPIVSGVAMAPEFADDSVPDADILFLVKEVTDILDRTVKPIEEPRGRLNAIISILNGKVRFDTESDQYATKTAMETWETGTGNCLSFTSLFVAMARYAGLEAGYQEVSNSPNWNREKGIIFVSKHISAYATLYTDRDNTVDLAFTPDDRGIVLNSGAGAQFASLYDRADSEGPGTTVTPIPDHRAFAQYYNNVASMHLAGGDPSTAFRYFAKALRVEPGLDFIWSNLGVAYSRNQRLDAAEEAFLHALSIAMDAGDITVLSIMNNMVKLYERRGDQERADFFRGEVTAIREQNPYYHYLAGQSALSDASYKESVKHFKDAIRRKGDDDMFYYGLAMAYLKLGDLARAEKNIDKARLYAWNDETREYYGEVLAKISGITRN